MTRLICLSLFSAILLACQDAQKQEQVKPAQSTTEPTEICLSPAQLGNIELETQTLENKQISHFEELIFEVEESLNASAELRAPTSGKLLTITRKPGQNVRAGELLARIESPENFGGVIELKAPKSGQILSWTTYPGEYLNPGQNLLNLRDWSELRPILKVPERLLHSIQEGQRVQIKLASDTSRSLVGILGKPTHHFNSDSRTFDVEIKIKQKQLQLGMQGIALLQSQSYQAPLALAVTAIQNIDGEPTVFIRKNDSCFVNTKISLGKGNSSWIEVQAGLKKGDLIVTKGSFDLKAALLKGELGEE